VPLPDSCLQKGVKSCEIIPPRTFVKLLFTHREADRRRKIEAWIIGSISTMRVSPGHLGYRSLHAMAGWTY